MDEIEKIRLSLEQLHKTLQTILEQSNGFSVSSLLIRLNTIFDKFDQKTPTLDLKFGKRESTKLNKKENAFLIDYFIERFAIKDLDILVFKLGKKPGSFSHNNIEEYVLDLLTEVVQDQNLPELLELAIDKRNDEYVKSIYSRLTSETLVSKISNDNDLEIISSLQDEIKDLRRAIEYAKYSIDQENFSNLENQPAKALSHKESMQKINDVIEKIIKEKEANTYNKFLVKSIKHNPQLFEITNNNLETHLKNSIICEVTQTELNYDHLVRLIRESNNRCLKQGEAYFYINDNAPFYLKLFLQSQNLEIEKLLDAKCIAKEQLADDKYLIFHEVFAKVLKQFFEKDNEVFGNQCFEEGIPFDRIIIPNIDEKINSIIEFCLTERKIQKYDKKIIENILHLLVFKRGYQLRNFRKIDNTFKGSTENERVVS